MPPPANASGNFQKPGVVFQPETYRGLQKGVDLIVNAVRPTLGPLPRMVGVEHSLPGKLPELLDSGGTIARRIPQVLGRNSDMGAMFTRHVLWKLQERVGDGTTTAAILLQSIFNQGVAYVAAGGNAQLLRGALEKSLGGILTQLDRLAVPLQGKAKLAHFTETVCYDPELSQELGQIFDLLGPYGRLEIRTGRGRDVTHEFVQGVYWDEGVLHPEMIEDKHHERTILFDGAVLATDLEIKEAEDTIHLLEVALQEEISGILLICRSIEGAALAPLMNPLNRNKVKVLAVKVPGNFVDVQSWNLTDISVMTGARPVLASAGGSLRSVRLEDFGQARRIWAYRDTFGITTGKGDPHQIRQHVAALRRAYLGAHDQDRHTDLEKRLGRLMGGAATLWIGASSQDAYETKKALAERASRALRAAMIGGVITGGGTGLLACRSALEETLCAAIGDEERAALRILIRAFEDPFRTLLWNAGIDAGRSAAILAQIGNGRCYDIRRQSVVVALDDGLVDGVEVLKQAVHSAVSSAALLLTTDVLVHLKNPPMLYHT
jgi:chaperonin GroEL